MEYDRLERTRATEESLRERLETQVYAESSPLQRAWLGAGSRAGRLSAVERVGVRREGEGPRACVGACGCWSGRPERAGGDGRSR
jgi:hypothetical protein